MNIKEIKNTILIDNIVSEKLTKYKNNYLNSTEKPISIYSLYEQYFNINVSYFYLYLGIDDKGNHLFSVLDTNNYNTEFSTLSFNIFKIIDKDLFVIFDETNHNSILLKDVKDLSQEKQVLIYEIIKNKYSDQLLNFSSFTTSNSGVSTWSKDILTLDEFYDFKNEMDNKIRDLENKLNMHDYRIGSTEAKVIKLEGTK